MAPTAENVRTPWSLIAVHAAAALLGAWFIVQWVDEGTYAITAADARLILTIAPIAAAIASLLLDRYLLSHWLKMGLVCVVITLFASIAFSSAVAIDGLMDYHEYMSRDATYSYDIGHTFVILLIYNGVGAILSAMTILPAIVVTTSVWRFVYSRARGEEAAD